MNFAKKIKTKNLIKKNCKPNKQLFKGMRQDFIFEVTPHSVRLTTICEAIPQTIKPELIL